MCSHKVHDKALVVLDNTKGDTRSNVQRLSHTVEKSTESALFSTFPKQNHPPPLNTVLYESNHKSIYRYPVLRKINEIYSQAASRNENTI